MIYFERESVNSWTRLKMCSHKKYIKLTVLMTIVTSLVIKGSFENASAKSTVPPRELCLHGRYQLCDWANWFPWGECSNGCGTGVRIRRKMICCPRNIKINNASKCVVDLYTKNATGADESAGIGYEGNEFISGSRNVGGGSKCGVWSRGQINTVDLFPTAVGVILGLAVLTTTCICCFFLCKRWSDEKKKKRKKFKRWDKKVRPLPQSRRVNIPIGCTVKNV